MSSRRTRITEDEINELILKLQELLPDSSSRCNNTRVSASKILKETCNYIKRLQKDVDGLSERLSRLLASRDLSVIDADMLSSLLRR